MVHQNTMPMKHGILIYNSEKTKAYQIHMKSDRLIFLAHIMCMINWSDGSFFNINIKSEELLFLGFKASYYKFIS